MNELSTAHTDAQIPAWRHLPTLQQSAYPDKAALADVVADLRRRPPLVFAREANSLHSLIAQASAGEAFVLMSGDYAKSFTRNTADNIRLKVQTILQIAAVLTYGASTPVAEIGRVAGQYAKSRSSDTEVRGEVTLLAFRDDSVNDREFTPEARIPDPTHMLDTYLHSGTTLNLIRAFTMGGYADLREIRSWNRGFTANPAYERFESFAEELGRAVHFIEATGVDFEVLRQVDFYATHETLLLEYEDAMTHEDSRSRRLYDISAHMLWVEERTREADGAHVAILAGVHSPVDVKIGPTTSPDGLSRLMDRLNPKDLPGRLPLIAHMGADHIHGALPSLMETVRVDKRPITWIAGPMYGNTITSDNGYKTRRFETVLGGIRGFFEVHRTLGIAPDGIHVEFTSDDVTEVLGGGEHVDEASLAEHYEILVGPRFNRQRSLEVAFEVIEMLKG